MKINRSRYDLAVNRLKGLEKDKKVVSDWNAAVKEIGKRKTPVTSVTVNEDGELEGFTFMGVAEAAAEAAAEAVEVLAAAEAPKGK